MNVLLLQLDGSIPNLALMLGAADRLALPLFENHGEGHQA